MSVQTMSNVDPHDAAALSAQVLRCAELGCDLFRLTVPDARWIFYNICYDTTCEIRKGNKNDEEMKAIREQMHFAAWKDNADLSVGNTPYTDNWRIEDVQIDMPYVHATQPPAATS